MVKVMVRGEFSKTSETPLHSAAAVLRTLVPGSSSTHLNMRTSRKLVHKSAGINFWTYVDWETFLVI
jgi:hypothetical protein